MVAIEKKHRDVLFLRYELTLEKISVYRAQLIDKQYVVTYVDGPFTSEDQAIQAAEKRSDEPSSNLPQPVITHLTNKGYTPYWFGLCWSVDTILLEKYQLSNKEPHA